MDLILELSNSKIDKTYTYKVPKDLEEKIYIGCPVFVKFGNLKKHLLAYIVDIKKDINLSIDKSTIKEFIDLAKTEIQANKNLIDLAFYIKKYYGTTFSKALSTVMPVKTKLKKKVSLKTSYLYDEVNNRDIKLNEEQKRAYDKFLKFYKNGENKTYLLNGITGSGKTLLYINIIKQIIRDGKQAIVLIPEISLTYQTLNVFIEFFKDRVAILNSKLSKSERVTQIEKVLNNEVDIVIGPRSALFVPFDNLGLIVIDEEHDAAYKSDSYPKYDSRILARYLSKITKSSLILASATPSPETYKKVEDGEYELLELRKRAFLNAKLPKIHIVDLREELKNGNRSIFSKKLEELIIDRLNKKEQIMLFINRRGYSNFISCRSCGKVIKCPHCDISLTLHKNNFLYCHYCSYKTRNFKVCPSCSSPYLASFGTGTEKLEILTKKVFEKAKVLRLDYDTTKNKYSSLDIIKAFKNKEADILIGTQMIVKGHDFENVTLVGIMAADTSLYINDYKSSQRTFELITQAAGRAGRRDKEGDVVIQTYNPMHYSLIASLKNDYDFYYKNEISFRKISSYPPIVHILAIQLSAKDGEVLDKRTKEFFDILYLFAGDKGDISLIGPIENPVYKMKDYFRTMIYIKTSKYEHIIKIQEYMNEKVSSIKNFDDIYIGYDNI